MAFSGDEPTNISKGQWPVLNSPLVKTFSKEAQKIRDGADNKAKAKSCEPSTALIMIVFVGVRANIILAIFSTIDGKPFCEGIYLIAGVIS